MEFQSSRLSFRLFQPQDYPLYSSVFSDERIMKYSYFELITDEKGMQASYRQVLDNNCTVGKRDRYEFAVSLTEDESFIGYAIILVHYHFTRVKNGEIGYFLLPEFWGKGYATEIAGKLAEVCFTRLGMQKVVASCNANNAASENIMKKLGMRKEAELRKERYKDGRWDNECIYGLLIEEWNAK